MYTRIMHKYNFWLWAFYDFANSLGYIILSFYFALWFSVDEKQPESLVGIVLAFSTIVLILTLPLLGKYSDNLGRKKPFLVWCTNLAIMSLFGLGVIAITKTIDPFWKLIIVLGFYFLFQYFYQASLAFYDAFLKNFTHIKTAEKISGTGMALGQIGNIVGILIVFPIVAGKVFFFGTTGREAVFLFAATIFFCAFLPVWFFLKEQKENSTEISNTIQQNPKELFKTFKTLKKHPEVLRYLITYYLFADAILTLQVFLSVYLENVMGFTDKEKTIVLVFILIFAVVGAFTSHFFTRLFKSTKNAITFLIGTWAVLIALFAIAENKLFFTAIILLNGVAFGILFALSRAYYATIIPVKQQAEFFSIYVLFERAASILGPLLWSLTVFLFASFGVVKYRFAVIMLAVIVGISFFIFREKTPQLNKT